MADITTVNLYDLVPDSIRDDPEVSAAIQAIDSELKAVSALCMVLRRCAITILVRFFIRLFSASCTSLSDSESRAEVASSRIRIGGFFKTARAMLIR